jgi:molybdate transport system ATP-binding protein
MIEFEFTLEHGRSFALNMAGGFASGQLVTLFGPSGAGKSTLLRLLAGLATPSSGRLVVDGEVWFDSTAGINKPAQQRAIGMVFQDYALFPNMSVRENLLFAAGKREQTWVEELLELTGLSALAGRRPSALSGGQQQRVALARALARKPRLLLLDEPLSALDAGLRLRLQQEIASLHRRFGLTTILVSHDVAEVYRLAEQVLLCEHGRIVRQDTPQAVFMQRALSGNRLTLSAELLAKRQSDVVWIMTLLVGQDIVEVMASAEEAQRFAPGDRLALATNTFGALLMPHGAPA